jgi:hypothetical protein
VVIDIVDFSQEEIIDIVGFSLKESSWGFEGSFITRIMVRNQK